MDILATGGAGYIGSVVVEELVRRPGDPPALVASSQKIRRELGWRPRYPDLRDIVQSAWEWQRTHPYGYGD